MPKIEGSGAARRLESVDSFQAYAWLLKPYADVAAAQDFRALSGFEQWERLHDYVKRIAHQLGRKNVETLDGITNEARSNLLQWLEENLQRSRTTAVPQTPLPTHRLLHSKI